MDSLERFEALAAMARREPPLELDVADGVLRRLAVEPPRAQRELGLVARFSVALSVLAAVMAVPCWAVLSDPLVQLVVPISLELR